MENETRENFNPTAEKLAKNPLGIIALFIVLVYALSASTLIFSSIPYDLQKLLVYFIVIFPVFVLIAFFILVTKHHDKLYSPADYKDEAHFMETRYPVTGELRKKKYEPRTSTKPDYKEVKSDIKEVENALDSIEKVSSSKSLTKNDEVSKLVEKAQETISDVKTRLDWSNCLVRVNELLPQYSKIKTLLKTNKIPMGATFGTQDATFGQPEILLLTFTQKARISHIKEIIALLNKNEITVDAINYSFGDENDNNVGIYIGSYSYQNEKYAKITPSFQKILENPQLTRKQLTEKIKESCVTNNE